jgi:hypothetical protein
MAATWVRHRVEVLEVAGRHLGDLLQDVADLLGVEHECFRQLPVQLRDEGGLAAAERAVDPDDHPTTLSPFRR